MLTKSKMLICHKKSAYLASELVMPWLNFDIAEITFGRLRPFHTNAVIFGFGGSGNIVQTITL
jgi:cbb3-type cytochrome oxidase subunit 1